MLFAVRYLGDSLALRKAEFKQLHQASAARLRKRDNNGKDSENAFFRSLLRGRTGRSYCFRTVPLMTSMYTWSIAQRIWEGVQRLRI